MALSLHGECQTCRASSIWNAANAAGAGEEILTTSSIDRQPSLDRKLLTARSMILAVTRERVASPLQVQRRNPDAVMIVRTV
jgi:hypothetical protein